MKQVIVVRTDLRMSVGKLAAQACHASVSALLEAQAEDVGKWLNEGQTKVVLQVSSEDALVALQERCSASAVAHALISDAGRTELAQGTLTALGVGPATAERVDAVTGALSLLR